MNQLIHDIKNTIIEIFDNNKILITESTIFNQIEGWDSFKKVELLLSLESKWGIMMSPTQIDRIESVQDLLNIKNENE